MQHNKHVKVIIVGAHGEAKELINRVSSGWSISVVDLDQEKLRNFNTNRQIDKIQGDATSSLVLKKAGIDEATAIVTLTLSDEVNLEILNIAKQNNILRLSSIINDSSNAELIRVKNSNIKFQNVNFSYESSEGKTLD